jgi:hypothetical protein
LQNNYETFNRDIEGLKINSPERALAVAVLQRAITDACSPIGISQSDRKSALDFIFLEVGIEWGYSLSCLAGYLSDDPEALVDAIRSYVQKARAYYEMDGSYLKKKRCGRRPWVPIPLESLSREGFRGRLESPPAGLRKAER